MGWGEEIRVLTFADGICASPCVERHLLWNDHNQQVDGVPGKTPPGSLSRYSNAAGDD